MRRRFNPVFHKRSKHIAFHHHFLRNMKVQELVAFEYVSSEYNIADVLTKPLHKREFHVQRFILMGSYATLLVATHQRFVKSFLYSCSLLHRYFNIRSSLVDALTLASQRGGGCWGSVSPVSVTSRIVYRISLVKLLSESMTEHSYKDTSYT